MKLPQVSSLTKTDWMEVRFSTYATLFIFGSAIILAVAFITPFWLQSETIRNQKFERLGLWEACFIRITDYNHRYDRTISGCRWIFEDDLEFLLDYLEPAFFIITQILFTAGFLLLVLVCVGIVAVQQCFIIEREDYALRALSVASALSAISCSSAVIIFAINGTREDWMPDPQHIYLSWSFAFALVGSILLWVAALLFYIEMQLTIKRQLGQSGNPHSSNRSRQ